MEATATAPAAAPAAPAGRRARLPAFEDPRFLAAEARLSAVLALAGVCESHGLAHARDVAFLAGEALEADPDLPEGAQLEVLLAALLHDADDHKFFPANGDYQNAREALACAALPADRAERVVRMISWVSASRNGDSVPPEAAGRPWMLYPRHADRLAAMGWTGVFRCWKHTLGTGCPLYTEETPRAVDEADLWERVATPARYAAYRGDSASMVDHYYDKLLRVGRASFGNTFLAAEAERRRRPLVEVALLFGRDGALPSGLYDEARAASEKERRV